MNTEKIFVLARTYPQIELLMFNTDINPLLDAMTEINLDNTTGEKMQTFSILSCPVNNNLNCLTSF